MTDVVSAVFALPWTRGALHRAEHPACPAGPVASGAEGFRGVSPYSARSFFLRGVSPENCVFAAGSPGGGVFGGGEQAAVAAAAVGAGCVVVLGDLNAEWGTAALVRRLCGVHALAPQRGAAMNILGTI